MASTADRSQFSASGFAPSMAARMSTSDLASLLTRSCQAALAAALPWPSGPTARMVWMALAGAAAWRGEGMARARSTARPRDGANGFISTHGVAAAHAGINPESCVRCACRGRSLGRPHPVLSGAFGPATPAPRLPGRHETRPSSDNFLFRTYGNKKLSPAARRAGFRFQPALAFRRSGEVRIGPSLARPSVASSADCQSKAGPARRSATREGGKFLSRRFGKLVESAIE